MNKLFSVVAATALLAACSQPADESAKAEVAEKPMASGIDQSGFDTSVRPQDDFFQYANGKWIAENPIPADKTAYGITTEIYETVQDRVRGIIETAAAENGEPGSNSQKVGDFFASYMDEARIEELGISPIQPMLDDIAAVKSHDEMRALMAQLNPKGVSTPVGFYASLDDKDSTRYVLIMGQGGLGLPDRDYYLKDEERLAGIRDKYVDYVALMLGKAGVENAEAAAKDVMALETGMAEPQWTRVDNRDSNKTYNPYQFADLAGSFEGFDYAAFLNEAGVPKINDLIISQPSYFEAFAGMYREVPLETWKHYMTFHTVNAFASRLSSEFVEASFDFNSRTLSGQEENRPRWKRAVSATNGALGEVIGQLYVEEYFPPEAKQRMVTLVENLRKAFAASIDKLEWMSEETKQQAQEKLAKVNFKIGYPDKWRDYSALEVKAGDLIGNTLRAAKFEHDRNMAKLGSPVDRDEWLMSPQTVNAYYWPNMNEIVFPAAILQPPFFDMSADDAVNYGGIGGVIGHEFSHGFDDSGADYDGDGLLRNWWTEQDLANFEARGKALIEQYNQYEPLEGMHINGELTLGENIGDLSGLTMAHRAYHIALDGEEAPVIDGLTGEQRFFLGWAQVWRSHYRDQLMQRRLMTDSHSPAEYRVNGVVVNVPMFHEAFDTKEGDGMYKAPEDRVAIW